MPVDTTSDDYQRQLPTPWSSVFGDQGADLDIFADPPQEPAPNSSASLHAARVQRRAQARAHDRTMAQLQTAARDQADDHELAEVLDRLERGRTRTVTPKMASAAIRALRRCGDANVSSAELHAQEAGTAQDWTPDQGA